MSNSPVRLPNEVLITSRLFSNGAAIEQLRDHNLLFSNDGHQELGPIVSYDGVTYAGVTFGAEIQRALRLPARAEDFGTIETLISSIVELLVSYGVDREISWRLAVFILGTWVADCLPGVPIVNCWGPAGTESMLQELLQCLCRRPMRTLAAPLRELAKLPADLCPTILLANPKPNALVELTAAAGQSGVGLFFGGSFRRINCAVVVYSAEPLSCTALDIPLLTSVGPYRRITGSEAEAISELFQPRLLSFRLKRHLKVAQSQFDCPQFAPTTRLLARIIGAAIEGDAENQTRLVDVLKATDEQTKVEQSQSPTAAVLEALLALSHEKKNWAQTADIANLTNAILQARGDRNNLSARAVGTLMRNKLGLESVRSGFGWRVKLTNKVKENIHRLAEVHGVLSMVDPALDCQMCQLYGTTGSRAGAGVDQCSQSS